MSCEDLVCATHGLKWGIKKWLRLMVHHGSNNVMGRLLHKPLHSRFSSATLYFVLLLWLCSFYLFLIQFESTPLLWWKYNQYCYSSYFYLIDLTFFFISWILYEFYANWLPFLWDIFYYVLKCTQTTVGRLLTQLTLKKYNESHIFFLISTYASCSLISLSLFTIN